MMNKTKSAFELLQEEFCTRYGINPDQLSINIYIHRLDSEELAKQIVEDHASEGQEIRIFDIEETCATGFSVQNYPKGPDVAAFAYWKELK